MCEKEKTPFDELSLDCLLILKEALKEYRFWHLLDNSEEILKEINEALSRKEIYNRRLIKNLRFTKEEIYKNEI